MKIRVVNKSRLIRGMLAVSGLILSVSSGWANNFAHWEIGVAGDWGTTNYWADDAGAGLPAPSYPATNDSVWIETATVVISSQNVSIAEMFLTDGATLTVTNGKSLVVNGMVNDTTYRSLVGTLCVPTGTVSLLNTTTSRINGLYFVLGSSSGSGYLDLGALWGATNGFRPDVGTLENCWLDLTNGGFRVDASNISMRGGCAIRNWGQEMTFRGGWSNVDASTVWQLRGGGTSNISIGGDFFFAGCTLDMAAATNGIRRINVAGNAMLTGSVLKMSADYNLSTLSASYDLIRVPAANTIYTNGLLVPSTGISGRVQCSVMLDLNRGGFDYLIITNLSSTPYAFVTNPVDGAIYNSGTNLTLIAQATDRDGTITKVEFYRDDTKIGEDTSAPYTYDWTNVLGGSYEIRAYATDTSSMTGVSSVVTIGVQGATSNGYRTFVTSGATITYQPGCVE